VETFKEKEKKAGRMKCTTIRLIPKWNEPDHSESGTENHLHSGCKPTCRTTTIVPLQWYNQHFIRTMSPPADLLQLPFFAINRRPACWYVAQ